MDWKLFLSTFCLIFVAELPDKTAFATLLMAARGSPWPIFIGVALAFVLQSAIAVTCGQFIGALPARWVHLGAGLLFLAFAVAALRRKDDPAEKDEAEKSILGKTAFWAALTNSFLVIFIAEWGDLTQLATASLAARYRSPLTIFFSATLALWSVTAVAIFVGHRAKKTVRPHILSIVAAAAFFLVGLYFLWVWMKG